MMYNRYIPDAAGVYHPTRVGAEPQAAAPAVRGCRKAGRDAQQRARRQQRPARAVQKPRRAHGAGQQRAKRQCPARPDRSVSLHVPLPFSIQFFPL